MSTIRKNEFRLFYAEKKSKTDRGGSMRMTFVPMYVTCEIMFDAPGGTYTCIHWTVKAVVLMGEKEKQKISEEVEKIILFYVRFYDPTRVRERKHLNIVVYICFISYPYDGVEFGHSHLFSSFDRRGHLLLVLYKQYHKKKCKRARCYN